MTAGAPSDGRATGDVAIQQRRLIITLAITGVCALAAIAGIVGGMAYHIGWMTWLFLAALLVGFGAHLWFMVGFLKCRGG
ncbi:hypothetical protein ACO2Q3_08425 [Caulobacter sp. KR2-114]|uniref:hypothetical protein n=1 Tax=Caulobacter sp. KR2-114 TaxID=3400912 RepID=UPI003C0E03A6